jgi:hypothetical protein
MSGIRQGFDLFGDSVLHVLCGLIYVNLAMHGSIPAARVSAGDLIISIQGGSGALSYSVSKDNGATWITNANPELASVLFGCADLGVQPVLVRITDGVTTSTVEAAAVVSDQYGICS